jgi:hypothetical protein
MTLRFSTESPRKTRPPSGSGAFSGRFEGIFAMKWGVFAIEMGVFMGFYYENVRFYYENGGFT